MIVATVGEKKKSSCAIFSLAEEGISLMELLVSIVAAVVILGAVLSAMLHHAAERRTNAELNLALVACTNNLDELRSLPFSLVPTMDGVGFDVPGIDGQPGGLEPLPGDPDGLPGGFSVTMDQTSGGVVLYLVTATVNWNGARGRQRVELESLVGERK